MFGFAFVTGFKRRLPIFCSDSQLEEIYLHVRRLNNSLCSNNSAFFSEPFNKILYVAQKSQKTGKLRLRIISYALVCMLFMRFIRNNATRFSPLISKVFLVQ